tara:strand:- start:1130 stop:3052 length:1923 start_codon:yes stop_codon:yes gene_type:complete
MEIRNAAGAAELAASANKAKTNSPIDNKAYQMFYKTMQAERKGRSQIEQGDDLEKVSKSIDQAMDFATKLMLSSAKNMGFPDEDGGGSKSTEMMEMAKGVSEMMIAKANVNAQIAQLKASKNPVIDLMNLKGKVVDYNDDSRSFYGKPVTYNYKVSHSEQSESAFVTNHFTIYDEQGLTVRNITQTGKSGTHTLEWDGKDNSGNEVMPGKKYTLAIKSEGKKDVGGNSNVSFPVTSSATLSGVVEGVKIENGSATGVVINGHTIYRDQIVNVRDIEELENDVALNTDLIGQKVELDLSRAQVKNGFLDVYFNNHVEKPGHLKAEVYDSNDKYITTLINKEEINVGSSKVRFPVDLDNGNYKVKVSVQDLKDPANIKNVKLEDKRSVFVGAIVPRDGIFMSIDEEAFSAHNIGAVVGNFPTPSERKEEAYLNSTVTYADDVFVYKKDVENKPTILFDKAEDDSIIEYAVQNIYDNASGELVAIVRGEYRVHDLLNDNDQTTILHNMVYQVISNDVATELLKLNQYTEEQIAAKQVNFLKPEYQKDYNAGKRSVTFPSWNGAFIDAASGPAKEDAQYRREFIPVYRSINAQQEIGAQTTGNTIAEKQTAKVVDVRTKKGQIELSLEGDITIPASKVISAKKV